MTDIDLLMVPDNRDPTPQEACAAHGMRVAGDVYAEDCRRNRELDAKAKARNQTSNTTIQENDDDRPGRNL